ncbi:MAG: hypothetical protein M3416_03610 [Acidobacteriota bacterium]|nr:hypothetical protein [Acidobacteriota bacterium]
MNNLVRNLPADCTHSYRGVVIGRDIPGGAIGIGASQQIARATFEAAKSFEKLPNAASLRSPEVQEQLVSQVTSTLSAAVPAQASLPAVATEPEAAAFEAGDERGAMRILVDGFGGAGRFDALPPEGRAVAMQNSRFFKAVTSSPRPLPGNTQR